MKSDDKESGGVELHNLLKYLAGAIILTAAAMYIWDLLSSHWFGWDYGKRANFGDEFGPVGTFLSGITFFLLILSTIFQRSDLKSQTKALLLQQEALEQQIKEFSEQKDEMARAAAAQERANRLAEINLKVEVIRQRLAFTLIRYQTASDAGGLQRAGANGRFAVLISEMENLLGQHGIECRVPGGDQPAGKTHS